MPVSTTSIQFEYLSHYLKEHSGYQLAPGKEYILESRLTGVLQRTNIGDTENLIRVLKERPHGEEGSTFIQAMTINETMFFRDNTPFNNIRDHILPAITTGAPARRINFWCAACSSGQEPYSLAMTLDSVRDLYPGWKFNIMASDLSEDMIERARAGSYSDFEVGRGLPENIRDKYFTKKGSQWIASDKIRSMIEFMPVNLLRIPRDIGTFDVILCRNVFIYFSADQKREILKTLRSLSRTPSYLMVGASEVLADVTDAYDAHPSWKGVYVAR